MIEYNLDRLNIIKMGEGKTLIFLHGWGQSWESMNGLMTILSTNYHCVAIDLPGFGNSPEPEEDWEISDYCHLVEQLIYDNGWQVEAIIGHSFGGKIALQYALHHHLNFLILIASSTVKPKRKLMIKMKQILYKGLRWLIPMVPLGSLNQIFGSRDYLHSSPRMRHILIRAINTYFDYELQYVTVPTLLMWGKWDTETPFSQLTKHLKKMPLKTYFVAPRGTHFGHQEEPQAYAYRIYRFLRKGVE